MSRPSTGGIPFAGGQQHMPGPEEAPFRFGPDEDYQTTSTYPPDTSSTFFDLSESAAAQYSPMAFGYGGGGGGGGGGGVYPSTGDLGCAEVMNSIQHHGPIPPGISGVNEMAVQTNLFFMSTANPDHGFSRLDYDGDAIMDLTPMPESSFGNANVHGDGSSLCGTAWHEFGSNSLSSMQGIYDTTYSSDMLTSHFLPEPQAEVAWENDPSFQTAHPRVYADQTENGSSQHAENGNWSPSGSGMPHPGNSMVHPDTETSPHPGSSPAYVESRQGQPQCTSQRSQSSKRNGTPTTAKGISMQRKLSPLLPKTLPLSVTPESSTESTKTPGRLGRAPGALRRARPIPPARRGAVISTVSPS